MDRASFLAPVAAVTPVALMPDFREYTWVLLCIVAELLLVVHLALVHPVVSDVALGVGPLDSVDNQLVVELDSEAELVLLSVVFELAQLSVVAHGKQLEKLVAVGVFHLPLRLASAAQLVQVIAPEQTVAVRFRNLVVEQQAYLEPGLVVHSPVVVAAVV